MHSASRTSTQQLRVSAPLPANRWQTGVHVLSVQKRRLRLPGAPFLRLAASCALLSVGVLRAPCLSVGAVHAPCTTSSSSTSSSIKRPSPPPPSISILCYLGSGHLGSSRIGTRYSSWAFKGTRCPRPPSSLSAGVPRYISPGIAQPGAGVAGPGRTCRPDRDSYRAHVGLS